jgi:hypothetical protein
LCLIKFKFTEVFDDAAHASEDAQGSAELGSLENCEVSLSHFLVAALTFAGVVKAAVFPAIDVAVLFTGGGLGEDEDKDVGGLSAGTNSTLAAATELAVQLSALNLVAD